MGYYIDFRNKNLQGFKKKLGDTKLLPSQKVLGEYLDKGFNYLEKIGIVNLFEVQEALKTKEKALTVAKQSDLPENFWIVLRREVNGHHPQPRKLKDFSILPGQIINKLADSGIKATHQLYDKIYSEKRRERFCTDFDIDEKDCLLLAKLTDFCRLRYVNPDFATLLVKSQYDTIKKVKTANFTDLHEHLTELNCDKSYFKGKIALSDIELIIRDANYFNTELDIYEQNIDVQRRV